MKTSRHNRQRGGVLVAGFALVAGSLLLAGCATYPAQPRQLSERPVMVGRNPQLSLIDPNLPIPVKIQMLDAM